MRSINIQKRNLNLLELSDPELSVAIIGAGSMGKEYAKVLQNLNVNFKVYTNQNLNHIKNFWTKDINQVIDFNNFEEIVNLKKNTKIIICVSIENLFDTGLKIISSGFKSILIEKPVCFTIKQIDEIINLKNKFNSNIVIGYNRRFYNSVLKLKSYLAGESKILSSTFVLSENVKSWSGNWIDPSKLEGKYPLISQTSHMIDLLTFLMGNLNLSFLSKFGDFNYNGNVIFSGILEGGDKQKVNIYGDWTGSHKWKILIESEKKKYLLDPIEILKVYDKKTKTIKLISSLNSQHNNLKVGLLDEVKAFLIEDYSKFCNLEHQRLNLKIMHDLLK